MVKGLILVKLKEKGKPWEEVKGFYISLDNTSYEKQKEEAYAICKKIATANGVEVRWEFDGVGQGHYVSPPLK